MAAVLQVVGAAAITVGAALLLPAAGFIAGGVFMILFGVALSRPATRSDA